VCDVSCAVLQPEGEDNLKKMQLEALAILNGTYRDGKVVTLASPRKCLVLVALVNVCVLLCLL
jgi:hypothetical protein